MYNNIGSVYLALSEYKKAFEYFDKAFKIAAKLPSLTNHHSIAYDYNNVEHVQVCMKLDEHIPALKYYNKSLEMREAIYGVESNHTEIATIYNNMGEVSYRVGNYKFALEYFRKSLEMREAIYGLEEQPC